MVNDDCTLVVLCVGEGVEQVEEDPLTRHRDASRGTVPSPLDAHGGGEVAVADQLEALEDVAERAASQPELLNGRGEVTERGEVEEVGEGASTHDNPETSAQNQQEADGSSVPPPEDDDFAVASDVGDLMIDIPHDPPAQETKGVDAPRSPEPKRDEPPPADEPPAARDGFPESTDPRV
jgi:hypothetical protein